MAITLFTGMKISRDTPPKRAWKRMRRCPSSGRGGAEADVEHDLAFFTYSIGTVVAASTLTAR
jgi:hypothetical protein